MKKATLLRFTIRDMLMLTLLFSIALGWFVDHQRLLSELQQVKPWKGRAGALVETLKADGWEVYYKSDSGEITASKWNDGRHSLRSRTAAFFEKEADDLIRYNTRIFNALGE